MSIIWFIILARTVPTESLRKWKFQYSEDGSAFTPLADKDFLGSASATKVLFDAPVRAKSFRFIVKTGAGDGQGLLLVLKWNFMQRIPKP
mgnify:CR=1 FL=1